MTAPDLALFRLINGAHTPVLDSLFGVVSGMGDGLVVALFCTAVALWRFRPGLAALLAFAVSGMLAQLLKRMVDTPRPVAVLEHVHVLGDALRAHSFPSGHAASLGVLVALVWILFGARDWRCWMLSAFALFAAYGRIYGGVHFPTDAAAGFGIGLASMWGIWRGLRNTPVRGWEQSMRTWQITALLLAAEAVVLGLGYHIQPVTAQPLAWVVALAALAYLGRSWRLHGH